jgi:hypothetical protein
MKTTEDNLTTHRMAEHGLVKGERVLQILFPDEDSRPRLSTLERLVKSGHVPSLKLNRLRFYDPNAVRRVP